MAESKMAQASGGTSKVEEAPKQIEAGKEASKENIVSAKDKIFEIMAQSFAKPAEKYDKILKLDEHIKLIQGIVEDLKDQNSTTPRAQRRVVSIERDKAKITPHQREINEVQIKAYEKDLTDLQELRYQEYQSFLSAAGSKKVALAYEHLRSKADSERYTKKNLHFIKSKLLKTLNTFIQNGDKSEVLEVRELAKEGTESGRKLFKEKMSDVLDGLDADTFILVSGRLSKLLFEATRLTLLGWDPESQSAIDELTIPVDNENK